jgi:ABC-type sugar transport system substrate-binding protein
MTSQGKRFVDIAEKHKIPSIIINMGIDGISPGSSTRELNAFLLGQITPDDENAGYELAKTLITQAQLIQGSKSSINLIAFAGRSTDIASNDRINGLKKALKEFPEVKLISVFNTDWSTQSTIKAASDYSGKETISIVWAASDLMAIALSNFYSTKGLKQGKDIFIGGIDWTKQGLIAVKNNELTTTVGGHFAEAGWALILFYDYFNGKDFKSESTQFHSIMKPLTSQNVQLFLQNNESNRWADVNFKTFSKVLNPNLKSYKFDLVVLLRMAKS